MFNNKKIFLATFIYWKIFRRENQSWDSLVVLLGLKLPAPKVTKSSRKQLISVVGKNP